MDYNEALVVKGKNLNLIGSTNNQGFAISQLIIIPSDPNSQKEFMRLFLQSMNSDSAIQPFIKEDLEVWAIDLEHLRNANILFYERILK